MSTRGDQFADHPWWGPSPTRSALDAGRIALWALILRDLVVLRKHLIEFVIRVLVQPFLLCFVFLYVFPKIGQGIGGGGGPAAESAFATLLVPGRGGDLHPLPGRAVGGPDHVPGVRIHPRDRGPGAGPVSHLAGGHGQGPVRRRAGSHLGDHRPAHRLGGPRQGGRGPPQPALVDHRDPGAAGLRHHGLAGSAARDQLRAPQHRPDVRVHHPAGHLPRRHLLRVDPAGPGRGRRVALAADPGAHQSAHLRQRGDAGGLHRRPPHAPLRRLSGADRAFWPCSSGSGCAISAGGCCPEPIRAGGTSTGSLRHSANVTRPVDR